MQPDLLEEEPTPKKWYHTFIYDFLGYYMIACSLTVTFYLVCLIIFGGKITIHINWDSWNHLFKP